MEKAVFIIALENFRDEELFIPKKILDAAGVATTIAAQDKGVRRGSQGGEIEATVELHELSVREYDAIIFVGGPGSHLYFDHPTAHRIAKRAMEDVKILAAICAAPCILAQASVLEGRRVTCSPTDECKKILEAGGAMYVDEPVVVDDHLITASGPDAAEVFGQKIVEMLRK